MRSKPSLLVTRRLPEAVEARACRDYAARLNPRDERLDQAALIARAEGVDALLICLTEKLDAATIAALPACVKIVATFSVGLDHIDLEAARGRGLIVANTPDVLTDATAEIALLLVLGACRRAGEGERMVRARTWGAWSPTGFLGTSLAGKRVGILGLGRIGQAIAARLKPFGVTLHYHGRRPVEAASGLGAQYHAELRALLQVSDVLVIACASTAQTRGMIDAAALALLPPGAVLVNIARGDIIVDDAVLAALSTGGLAAAGLDVFRNEPDIHPGWRESERAFLLPHLGSATLETRIAMGMRALDNLDAWFAGESPKDRVV